MVMDAEQSARTLTNKSGGIILNKQNFVFDHQDSDHDIRKDY